MLFQKQSLPALNSFCYQSNNEECESQLRPLYLLIRENQIDVQQENITLVGLFKLLKIWKLDIPFSILAKLMLNANKYCNQQLNQMINLHSLHQLMHNPQLQMIYRKKPKSEVFQLMGNNAFLQNCQFSTPQTLVGLFSRLGELMQRKQMYLKINNENIDAKDKYSYIIQMMQNTPEIRRSVPETITLKNRIVYFWGISFSVLNQKWIAFCCLKNKRIRMKMTINFLKLINLSNKSFKIVECFRFEQLIIQNESQNEKMHTTMMKHMLLLKQNSNVNKINKLIQQTQGPIQIKLPEI